MKKTEEVADSAFLDGVTSKEVEYMVSTSDGSSDSKHDAIAAMLRDLRLRFAMDVVFVSEFLDGKRVFKYVDAGESAQGIVNAGASDPLEDTFCQLIVDGRLPNVIPNAQEHPMARNLAATSAIGIGAFLSVPVILDNGQVYGTVCCFSKAANPTLGELDVGTLKSVAKFVSKMVQSGRA